MHFEQNSDMEGLRIPHFYSSFYVYKYATGISAALALAKRVTEGGAKEREDYFAFLKSGGSRYPIESLRIAGDWQCDVQFVAVGAPEWQLVAAWPMPGFVLQWWRKSAHDGV